jgi:hypothetical protein
LALFFFLRAEKTIQKTNDPSGQKFTVNFTAGDLGKMATNSSKLQTNSVADTFKKYVKTYWYLVYNNSGQLVHWIKQDSTTTNLGNISDSFNPGTYTVIFIGNATVSISQGLSGDYFFKDYFTSGSSLPDFFIKSLI